MKFPRIEDLFAPKLLSMYGEAEERWPVDEDVVTQALSPMYVPQGDAERFWHGTLHSPVGAVFAFAGLIRTAALYVVDATELHAALESAIAGDDGPLELPPLPFPRLCIEALQDVPLFGARGGWKTDLLAINETQQGESWMVTELLARVGSDDEAAARRMFSEGETVNRVQIFGVEADKPGVRVLRPKAEDDDFLPYHENEGAVQTRRLLAETMHYVTARGVGRMELPVSRPQRRRFERIQKRISHPRVYFVALRAAESHDQLATSDREYHCRWLVRGHWRHLSDGRRTWVRPYIKGPVGAPWRGRPVYVEAA